LTSYDFIAEKLEEKGRVDHLKANINFRLSMVDQNKKDDGGNTVRKLANEMKKIE
jgi:hypothetical protein